MYPAPKINPVGTHLILNLYGIDEPIPFLTDIRRGYQLLDEAIAHLDLHVVNKAGHQFIPGGYTIAYVLSESHLTIHTYPEHNSAYLDIFCCNPQFNPQEAIALLKSLFCASEETHTILVR